jgi:hypothetical protein
MRFSERLKIAALTESANVTTAGVDSYSVHMGKVHEGCWLVNFGSITADDTLKVYVGASQGTKTTAVAYKYRLAAADTDRGHLRSQAGDRGSRQPGDCGRHALRDARDRGGRDHTERVDRVHRPSPVREQQRHAERALRVTDV